MLSKQEVFSNNLRAVISTALNEFYTWWWLFIYSSNNQPRISVQFCHYTMLENTGTRNRTVFCSFLQCQTFMSLKQPFQKGDKYLKCPGLIHWPRHLTKRLKEKNYWQWVKFLVKEQRCSSLASFPHIAINKFYCSSHHQKQRRKWYSNEGLRSDLSSSFPSSFKLGQWCILWPNSLIEL